MKNKIIEIIFFIIVTFFYNSYLIANEVRFEANSIDIIDKDNKIIAKKNVKIFFEDEIIINADEMDYDKKNQIIKANGNIIIENKIENLKIYGNNLTYFKNSEILKIFNSVKIVSENKFNLETDEIKYDILNKKIFINKESILNDLAGNKLSSGKIVFSINNQILKSKKVKLFDLQKNIYQFENAIMNFNSKEIIGDGIKIDFTKGSFGNISNDPRLRGNYVYANDNETIVKKGVFTTCKKNKDKCPPWQFKSSEIKHDKLKKTIYYKNAWLEIYDKPIAYFPRFFHPDPTVKRKSGFLMPTIKSSSSHGDSISIPYFQVIAENKDLTFTPQLFGQNEGLFQNEYRQENKNLSHISDFSLKRKGNSSKSHFFSNTLSNLNFANFDNSELEINIESTSNNSYLKSHKIKTEITNNNSLLNSFLSLKGDKKDLFFETKIEAFEDLTKENSSDKYQFLLPSFEISKNFNNNLSLVTNGHHKNYDTNIFEKVLINDLKYSTTPKISNKGLVSSLNLIFKNVTTESDNSSKYENKLRSHNYGSFLYDLSYPMVNSGNNFNNFFTGKASLMYSPNKNRNNQNLDRKINIQNVYSQNRLSLDDSVEGGQSLTVGTEYKITNKNNKNLFSANIASVLRDKNENSLPSKSTINNKTSDFIGSIIFEPNKNINLDYNFSLDNDLGSTNYNLLKTDFIVNKFITSFEYLQEDDEVGSESYFSNEMKLALNNSSSLSYKTRRNRKTDLTEYYNLIYEYKNDCLTAAIQYNKEYYSDKDLKPTEEIFFSISIMPFSKINSPSKSK